MQIPFTLSKVAALGVAPINASGTVSASGSGGRSVFAGVVWSTKGKPNELLRVTKDNWQSILGAPLRGNQGKAAYSLRCLAEALEGGDGYVVRAVPEAAQYPIIGIRVIDNLGDGLNTSAASSAAFGTAATPKAEDYFTIYPVDGDAGSRSIELTPIAGKSNQYTLKLYANDALGAEIVAKSWVVSADENAIDDNGYSMFLPEVLDRVNAPIRAEVGAAFNSASLIAGLGKTAFVGADNGSFANMKLTDWDKAINVLRNAMVGYTAVVGMGAAADVLGKLAVVANERRIDMFGDVDATSYAGAVSAMTSGAFNEQRLCMYFFPYKAKDPYYGSSLYWPISGLAFVAKAKGVAKAEGPVGGYHYSPAGVERGIINRKEVKPFEGLDTPDFDALYTARINKIGVAPNGSLMIDDALTTRVKEDYLLYQHISSTMDAITRDFSSMANNLRHEPDGITREGLEEGMTAICENYRAAEALVAPRNPEEDGTEPFIIKVKQEEIDLWSVSWSVCVTGSARRIIGQPALIR